MQHISKAIVRGFTQWLLHLRDKSKLLIIIMIIIIAKRRAESTNSLHCLHLKWPSFLVVPLDSIKYPHRVEECKFLLVSQHWCVHVLESIIERRLWVCPLLTSSDQHVLFIFGSLWDETLVMVQLLLNEVQLPEFVENNLWNRCLVSM